MNNNYWHNLFQKAQIYFIGGTGDYYQSFYIDLSYQSYVMIAGSPTLVITFLKFNNFFIIFMFIIKL